MNQETRKTGKTCPEDKVSELSEQDLEKVAGGGAFNTSKSGIKTICPKCGQQPCVCKSTT